MVLARERSWSLFFSPSPETLLSIGKKRFHVALIAEGTSGHEADTDAPKCQQNPSFA